MQSSLEAKIAIALVCVLCIVVGTFTVVDVRVMRSDMIQASQQSLGSLAAVVKGSVQASMRHGYHEDVLRIIEEARNSFGIDRIVMYNGQGKPVRSSGAGFGRTSPAVPRQVWESLSRGDLSDSHDKSGDYLAYYSPIPNQRPCFRCHGKESALNGILRIDFPLQGVESLIRARRNSMFVWTAIMIASLMVALVVLLRILVHKPVEELRNAMARAEAGNTDLRLRVSGSDEISDLKRGFVSMLERLNALHQANLDKEKELARSREINRFRAELQTMFDAMPDGVLLVDKNMRIIQSNPRIHALLPGIGLAGRLVDPGPGPGRNACSPAGFIGDVLAQGKMVASQCTLSLPGGETRHLHGICAPIPGDGKAEYAVAVIRDITDRVQTELELEEKTAELLAANRQLSRIAITDGLTQVYNRRHFDELLYKEIKRFNRRKYAHLSLMMLDIDHFKQLNDTHGHLAGDAVLREIANLLSENVRETDTVARYGGEEFAIIMPDTQQGGAAYRAEILRRKAEATEFRVNDRVIRTTITIGVAAYGSGTPQDLVNAADQALYQAKEEGRNRVVSVCSEVTEEQSLLP